MIFLLMSAALVAGMAALRARRGAAAALAGGWFAALFGTPTWLVMNLGSLELDARAVAGAVGLGMLFLDRPALPNFRWSLLDVAALGLFFAVTLSMYHAGEIRPLTIPNVAKTWLLPYAVGRLFFAVPEDLDRVASMLGKALLAIALLSWFESAFKFNPTCRLLGKSFSVLEAGEGYRWGIKRAQGNLIHPIFFGNLLALALPWCFASALGATPRWRRALPWIVGAAIVGTASRGAIGAAAATYVVVGFFHFPRWRRSLAVAVLVAGAGAYGAKHALLDAVGRMADQAEEEPKLIDIHGEECEYTGTAHRMLLFKAYGPHLANVGWLGYGFAMKAVRLEEELALRFGSIDSHYVLFLLQFGWLGTGLFLALAAGSVAALGVRAWRPGGRASELAGGLCGAMFAVTVSLNSVWFAPDFGVGWLFAAGLAANLRRLPDQPSEDAPPVVSAVVPHWGLRLHHGAAPVPNHERSMP